METVETLEKTVKDLEYRLFLNDMKDRWDSSDYVYARQLEKQLREVKEKLARLKEELA